MKPFRPLFFAACAVLMWGLAILDLARQNRQQHAQSPVEVVQPPASLIPANPEGNPEGPYEVVPIPTVRGDELDDEAKAMTIKGG